MEALKLPTLAMKPRAASFGGLGGFVNVHDLPNLSQHDPRPNRSWPRRRRKAPPPALLHIQQYKPDSYQGSPLQSAHNSYEPFPSPKTPSGAASPRHFTVDMFPTLFTPDSTQGDGDWVLSEERSRIAQEKTQKPLSSSSQAHVSVHERTARSFCIELPGSLLLPSQGFPQHEPPCPPPRSSTSSHSESAGSHDSSEQPLSTSSSLETFAMDCPAYSLGSPVRHSGICRREKFPLQSPARETVSSPTLHAETSAFLHMTEDQLLEVLPQLSTETITSEWIPAMKTRFVKQLKVFEGLSETNMTSQKLLKGAIRDQHQLLERAQKISEDFQSILRSARPSEQRNAGRYQSHLETVNHLLDELSLMAREDDSLKVNTPDTRTDSYSKIRTNMRSAVGLLTKVVQTVIDVAQRPEGRKQNTLSLPGRGARIVGTVAAAIADEANTEQVPALLYNEVEKRLEEQRHQYRIAREIIQEQQEVIGEQSMRLDQSHQLNTQHMAKIEQQRRELLDSVSIESQSTEIMRFRVELAKSRAEISKARAKNKELWMCRQHQYLNDRQQQEQRHEDDQVCSSSPPRRGFRSLLTSRKSVAALCLPPIPSSTPPSVPTASSSMYISLDNISDNKTGTSVGRSRPSTTSISISTANLEKLLPTPPFSPPTSSFSPPTSLPLSPFSPLLPSPALGFPLSIPSFSSTSTSEPSTPTTLSSSLPLSPPPLPPRSRSRTLSRVTETEEEDEDNKRTKTDHVENTT